MDSRCLWIALFFSCALWAVASGDQDGFLSLSCGADSGFTDSSNITWISDSNYVSSGNTTAIDLPANGSSSHVPLRFFPNSGDRICYRLPIYNASSLVLVRIRFVYNNYDRANNPPMFFVSLGTSIAATVNLTILDPQIEEFIWPLNMGIIPLCLLSIPGSGYPVISTIEIRPLPQNAYRSGLEDFPNTLLRKRYRINCGHTNGLLRYPFDPFDRVWDVDENFSPSHKSSGLTSQLSFNATSIDEIPPIIILQSARFLALGNAMSYNLPLHKFADYYIGIYLAGVLPVSPTFDVLCNNNLVLPNHTVEMSEANVLFFTQKHVDSLNITFKNISFYPLVNAIEVYEIIDIPLECSSTTVSALQVIQQLVGLDLGWLDDPCSPAPWNHIRCEGSRVTSLELSDISLRSISPTLGDLLDLKILDLHNTSLSGEIESLGSLQHLENLNLSFNQLTSFGYDLGKLISLQILDLHNNNLEGCVPEGLGGLQNLHLLNLENNELQGTLPQSLNRKNLEVRASGNLRLTFSTKQCNGISGIPPIEAPKVILINKRKGKSHNHMAAILGGAAAGAFLAFVLISVAVFSYMGRKRTEVTFTAGAVPELQDWTAAKVFTYKEIKAATNNFKVVIGRGSFGSVYLGKLPDGKPVAVKVRRDKSQLGADSFVNEVYLLSKLRNRNLVSLEGFCYESKRQILVYEYLPGGSLAENLYGASSERTALTWIRRLKIAIDAAKGLEYLHNGSKPGIIHRDVKCNNILLDDEMNAKVCDFGLSKQLTQPDATHITTVVKGTAGYLDPEYYTTQQLTEKSDVYSFGVVLLELICGREPLNHSGSPDTFNLVLWAKPYLQADAIEVVMDEKMKGGFDGESMRKAGLIALRAVERDASRRPPMAEVLGELQEAYRIHLLHLASSSHDI